MDADIRFAIVPANIARIPSRASSPFLFGASAPMPPIWIPMELRFANPQSANVAIVKERGSSASFIGPSMENATNSFSTMRVPSRVPITPQSCQGTPITQATGAKTAPKIPSRLSGNQATSGEFRHNAIRQRNQSQEGNQHGGDVQSHVQAVGRSPGDRAEQILFFLGFLFAFGHDNSSGGSRLLGLRHEHLRHQQRSGRRHDYRAQRCFGSMPNAI